MSKTYMTLRGAKQLQAELKQLKNVERPRIITDIAQARAHGDLKENAEYHAAREQQGFCEARIRDIEFKLANAEVVDVTKVSAQGRIIFGATVELVDEESGAQAHYQIVGEDEADTEQGRISIGSPLARALIGKQAGEVAEVQAPNGMKYYEVLQVRYQ